MLKVSSPAILPALIPILAGLTLACSEGTHELRGPRLQVGQILQTTDVVNLPTGTLALEQRGKTQSLAVSSEDRSVTELEVVAVEADGRPKTLKQSFPEQWTRRVVTADGRREEDVENGPLAGATVLIERTDGGFVQTLLDARPDKRQQRYLKQEFVEPAAIYPDKKIRVGESWTVEGPALARLFGMGDALSVTGKGTFTLDRVAKVEGERRAFISYRLEVTTVSLDLENTEVEASLGGSGTLQRSLDRGLDLENKMFGQARFATRASASRREPTYSLAGAMTLTSTERLVSPTERHAVLPQEAPRTQEPAKTAKPAAARETYELLSPSELTLDVANSSFMTTVSGGPPPSFLSPERAAEWERNNRGRPQTVEIRAGSIDGLSCGSKPIELVSTELQGEYLATRRFGKLKVAVGPAFYVTPRQKAALKAYCARP